MQHRSDECGTTANFANYLESNQPSIWTYGTEKAWPNDLNNVGVGSKGSDQVAASLNSTQNSIGYVEYSFTTEGDTLEIGPLATTRKACAEDVNAQETAYLAALEASTTFTIRGTTLELRDDDGALQVSYAAK